MLYFRSFNRFILISLTLLGLSIAPASAATLNIDGGGNLLGASGVNVGGSFYDVEFVDGSCATLFSDCDNSGDFAFTTLADAAAAAQALLDQVFVDGSGGNFDSDPSLTAGCTFTLCDFWIPYELGINGAVFIAWARNEINPTEDMILNGVLGIPSYDTTQDQIVGWARFSAGTPNAVPIPAAVWLFGTALIGLIGVGKRRARMAA